MPKNDWLRRHFSDTYVKKAHKEGFVARSSYKLLEVDERLGFIKKSHSILELGSAPGGWSQVIMKRKTKTAKLICNDLLDMKVSVPYFVQGDFLDESVASRLIELNDGEKFDLILSDIAPNMCGIPQVDQSNMNEVLENILTFVGANLQPRGAILVKVFMGAGFDNLLAKYKKTIKNIKIIKPSASRKESAEVYCFGSDLRSEVL